MTLSHNGFLALLPFVREEFSLTRTQVGYYSTFFFLTSAMLAVFTGSVVDKIGPKKGIIFGVVSLGSMNILFGFSPSYMILLVLALFAGLGQSIITPSLNKGVMIETPPEKRAVSMGIMQSGIGIGGLAGASLLPLLGENFGWRMSVQFAGIFVVLIGIFVYKVYWESSRNESLEGEQESQKEEAPSFKDNLFFLFTNKQILLTCLVGAVFAGASVGAVLSHFAVYLSEDLNMGRTAAGLGLGIFQIGGLVGRPAWGWISDRFLHGNRGKTIFLIGLVSGVMFMIFGLFLNRFQIDFIALIAVIFILGFSAFGWAGVFFVAIGEYAGMVRTGAATGLALLATRIGILVAPPIFGLIADITGNYDYSWLLFGIIIMIVSFIYYLSFSKR